MKLTNTVLNIQKRLEKETAKSTIIFPEGWNSKMIEASKYLVENNLCNLILLVRHKNEIKKSLKGNSRIEYIVVNENIISDEKERLINLLVETRKHKGMTKEKAKTFLGKTNYYGVLLIKAKEAGGCVGGIEYSTRDILRPALQIIKTKKETKNAGDYFLMEKDRKRFIFANCAVNLDPTTEQLVDLAYYSVKFAKTIGINTPRVAFLSYSTAKSGGGEPADKIRRAVDLFKNDNRFKGLEMVCEFQFDSAFNEKIRKKKSPEVSWKGSADIFIFPDLNAGNIGYKIAQQMAGFTAIGPILCGLANPVNDLSRGATLQDIISTVIITADEIKRELSGKI